MARQLTFDWPTGVALGAGDFFVSPANQLAYTQLRAPGDWPLHKLVLIGPAGSGKSHLARVFATETGASLCHATDLPEDLPQTALAVEDTHLLPRAAEERFFHIHNHLAAARLPLLITGKGPPAAWDIALPDLASRLSAATLVEIAPPDDALLEALLMKLFADRQVMPDATVISYIATRIERSFAAAAAAVAALDRAALEARRPITKRFAGPVLDSLAKGME